MTDTLIPKNLDTPEFCEAWGEWVAYRKECKKMMTDRSARMAVKRLTVWGVDRAVAAIEYSIAQGYQGIFEDPVAQGAKGAAPLVKKTMSLWEIQQRETALRNELDGVSNTYYGPEAERVNAERAEKRTKIRNKLRALKAAKLDL